MEFETWVWLYCSLLATFIPVLIPAIQFGFIYRLWDQYNKPVDKDHCFCSCWDTTFKAGYEAGWGAYKHVYFNITQNTLVMWGLTVLAVVFAYEATRKVFISLYKGHARPLMCILFLSVIYSHYYAWWAYFNYFNDDYYEQIWHQLLFTVTEIISTICVVYMVDAGNPIRPRMIVLVISIATFHILACFWDQFAVNVLRGEGQMHQVLRDLGFMAGDLLHMILPWMELKRVGRTRGVPPSHLIKDKDAASAAVGVAVLWIINICL